MPKKPKQEKVRWTIYRLKGSPAAYVGSVMAKDEDEAIRKAIKEYDVPRPFQGRLMARRS